MAALGRRPQDDEDCSAASLPELEEPHLEDVQLSHISLPPVDPMLRQQSAPQAIARQLPAPPVTRLLSSPLLSAPGRGRTNTVEAAAVGSEGLLLVTVKASALGCGLALLLSPFPFGFSPAPSLSLPASLSPSFLQSVSQSVSRSVRQLAPG